jgi:transposase
VIADRIRGVNGLESGSDRIGELDFQVSATKYVPRTGSSATLEQLMQNLQPRPGRQWAAASGKGKEPGRAPRCRIRATYHRTEGVRHRFAAYEQGKDKLFGHVKPRMSRAWFLEFCRYLRSLYPKSVRIAIVCDNFSPHLSTAKDARVGDWATANNVKIAYTPTNSSWLNRIEAQFTALRYFALDGTDHASHKEQASMIRRYIIWRNNHAYDERLRRIVDRANVA